MKYGFYRTCITPKVGTSLAGYTRKPTSDGIYDDLYLQMLMLEDDRGRRLLLLSMDLIGLNPDFVAKMRQWFIKQDPALSAAAINFSATHTHCGPTTCTFVKSVGIIPPAYMAFLEERMKDGMRTFQAQGLKPGTLHAGMGTCRLAINRRLRMEVERDGRKSWVYGMGPNFKGSTDPKLGLLQVKGRDEEILLINYACHPTTRGGYKVSGDYPGAATRVLRTETYPHREAMFLQGGAGDLRVPCMNDEKTAFKGGDSDKVVEYGNVIAKSVRQILAKGLTKLTADFRCARSEVLLPFDKEAELPEGIESSEFRQMVRWRRQHERTDGVMLEWVAWRLAKGCVLTALPGEVCHGIGLTAKRLSGAKFPLFLGYTNGCPTYIPTDAIIREGGYEGRDSMLAYGQPYPFKLGSETILNERLKATLAELNK